MSKKGQDTQKLFQATCAVGVAGPYQSTPDFQNSGCGTFISENEVVTCWHVLLLNTGQQVSTPFILIQNQKGEYSRVDKLIVDQGKDLVYIRLKTPIGHSHIPCLGSGRNIDLTDKFQLLSNYKGRPAIDDSLLKTVFSKKAKIKTADKMGKFDVFLTEQDIKKGYSGSAVLLNGQVSSVLSAKSLENKNEVWAPCHREFAKFVSHARTEADKPLVTAKSFFDYLKKLSQG